MNTLKYFAGTLGIVAILFAAGYVVHLLFPQPSFGASNAGGSSYGSAKIAEQDVVTGTTTTFSVLNTDSTDRIISSLDIQLANDLSTTTTITAKCATSTSASSLNGNTNYLLNTVLSTVGAYGTTTGAGMFIASSSPGITGTTTAPIISALQNPYARVWATNTYLDCQVSTGDTYNAFVPGTTGFFGFRYWAQ